MTKKNETVEASSINSEIMILGSILSNEENAKIGLKLVHEDDFNDNIHKLIFTAIHNVFHEKNVVDVTLVSTKLSTDRNLDVVGGTSYLIDLMQMAGTSCHIEAYCDDLKKFTRKRNLIDLSNTLAKYIQQGVDDTKILEITKERIKNIERDNRSSNLALKIKPYSLSDLHKDLLQTKEGLKTGYAELDAMVRIPNEAITLIAGRPSHGKTTFMLNLFLNLIENYPEQHFYFFSYEETCQQIAIKIINILSGHIIKESQNIIQLEGYLRSGNSNINAIEIGKSHYQSLVDSGRLRIIGETYYVQDLSSIIASLKSQKVPLGAVFIDYIQKIKNKQKFGTRQLELADTSNIILETAKGYSLPIVLGAQLGRGDSTDKVKLDNLREAGDLENDANLVLGLFNHSMNKSQNDQTPLTDRDVVLKVTPLKNRNGPVNKTIELNFDRPLLQIKCKKGTQ